MIFSFHSIRLQNYYCSKIFLWASLRSFKDISLDLSRLFWMRQVSKKHVWHICNCQLNARIVKIHDTPVLFILVTQKQPEMSREEEARALSPLFSPPWKPQDGFSSLMIFIQSERNCDSPGQLGLINAAPHNELYPHIHIMSYIHIS